MQRRKGCVRIDFVTHPLFFQDNDWILWTYIALMALRTANIMTPTSAKIDSHIFTLVMGGGYSHTFGDSGSKFGWSYHFGMASVSEDKAFKFVVNHYFQ